MSKYNSDIKGHTIETYDEKTYEIISSQVFIRPGYISDVIHENRHTRQNPLMTTCEREIEAFYYQSIFSPAGVQQQIQNARNFKYPSGTLSPNLIPEWGIKEMVEYLYNCK